MAEPFAPKKTPCPICAQPVIVAPAGHYLYHRAPKGGACAASGLLAPPETGRSAAPPVRVGAEKFIRSAMRALARLDATCRPSTQHAANLSVCPDCFVDEISKLCSWVEQVAFSDLTAALCEPCREEHGQGDCPARPVLEALNRRVKS